ncbi:restriction endonuclease subunit S [Lactiplantibacillus pentosus]|nr:restriction endonuclease subunit S [Lactiplantibacillus pentosus]
MTSQNWRLTMNANQAKYPQLRFKGFTDPWEQRKLSDISDVTKLAGFEFTKYVRYQETGKIIALRGLNVKNGKLVLDDVKYIDDSDFSKLNRSKLYKNDILLTYVGTVGELAIVPEDDKYYLAPNVARIRLQDHVNSIFICQMMNDSNFYNRIILPLIATSSQPALSMENVRKFQLLMPDYQEQQKIGSFFKQIDDTIALHQRKLAKLKELKQGYLQKMFPQNGSKFPQLRFTGFADAWEERKFFESIASTIDFRGRTPKKLGMDWSESGYLALSALNVKNGYIDPLADAHYGDENLYKKWMSGKELKKGQVLFTTEAPMGNVAQVPDNNGYILSQRTVAFETKEDMMTNDFLAVLLKSPLIFNNLSALSSGGTAKGVSQKSLKGLSITVPFDIDEQQKIGSFFKQLDDTIALHQRKLEKLQELKKGYLQKMFC